MPDVVYEYYTQTSNYQINASFKEFGMTKVSGDFPGTPYRITRATITFTRINVDSQLRGLQVYSNSDGINDSLVTTQAFQNYGLTAGDTHTDVVFEMSTGINYPALTRINLRSVKAQASSDGNLCSVRSSSYIRIIVSYEITTTAASAPTALSVNATLSEGNVTLSGAGAGGGVNNAITGFEIQYHDSADGANWWAWTGYTTVYTAAGSFSLSVAPPERGYYRRFRARTLGSAGASYYSGFVESANSVRRNRLPIAPASISASPGIYESGNIAISWPAGSDPDGNLSSYTVQYQTSADGVNWSGWADLTITAAVSTAHAPGLTRGHYIRYQVRSNDGFGVSSGYTQSGVVRRNQTPGAPPIVLPVPGVATYSLKPGLKVTVPAEPDGQAQKLQVSVDWGSYTDFVAGLSGAGATITPSINLATGAHTLTLRLVDSLGAAGPEVSHGITVVSPTWTRPLGTGTVIANGSIGHRNDINELLARINTARAFYGLSASALPGTVGKWADWKGQIEALQAALGACFTAVGKAVPSWTAVPAYPTAAIINQLRTQILAA